jgi:hypothetical protein
LYSSSTSDVNDESDKQKLTCADSEKRVKNDQKTGVQKGSKMAKNGGPKKGQKRAKNPLFRAHKKSDNKDVILNKQTIRYNYKSKFNMHQ